jgi:hypothetical protein
MEYEATSAIEDYEIEDYEIEDYEETTEIDIVDRHVHLHLILATTSMISGLLSLSIVTIIIVNCCKSRNVPSVEKETLDSSDMKIKSKWMSGCSSREPYVEMN